MERRPTKENKQIFFFSPKLQLPLYKINSNRAAIYPEDNARLLFFVVKSMILDNYHPHEWVGPDNEKGDWGFLPLKYHPK